jgi:hypothetical protein
MQVALTHPAGWGAQEQKVLRTAVVQAGLESVHDSHARIMFITESEAIIRSCLASLSSHFILTVSLLLKVR